MELTDDYLARLAAVQPKNHPADLDLFDEATATRGLRLNKAGYSLKAAPQRELFARDEEAWVDQFGLTDEERALVRARDWIGLWRHGMSIYVMVKLSGVTNTPLPEIGKQMRESGGAALLRRTQPGRLWLHELDAYLLRFGGRSRWHELSLPREAELPTMTLESLRLLLASAAAPAEREREPVPEELSALYERVRPANALKELHSYDIDYPGLLAPREALLGFGRRLREEGLLDGADDVWMLTFDELRAALLPSTSHLRLLVAERCSELAAGRAGGRPGALPRRAAGAGRAPRGARTLLRDERERARGGSCRSGSGRGPGPHRRRPGRLRARAARRRAGHDHDDACLDTPLPVARRARDRDRRDSLPRCGRGARVPHPGGGRRARRHHRDPRRGACTCGRLER
jgi:protocatechuate 4,5-dioxygenase, alpha chain